MTATVMLVEDDAAIGASLRRALVATGYDVVWAETAAAARRELDDRVPDLILLDLGLPDGDGLELCTEINRGHPELPIVMLTARAEEMDVVVGLNSGAIDYITKPFRLAELLARVQAQLRQRSRSPERAGGQVDHGDGSAGGTPKPLRIDDLEIHVGARRVLVGGSEINLRPREFDLLVRLAREPGQVVTRETLMADVWDEHWWGSTKTLDVHLNALRRKLGEKPGDPSRITAIRGVGYRLETQRPTA